MRLLVLCLSIILSSFSYGMEDEHSHTDHSSWAAAQACWRQAQPCNGYPKMSDDELFSMVHQRWSERTDQWNLKNEERKTKQRARNKRRKKRAAGQGKGRSSDPIKQLFQLEEECEAVCDENKKQNPPFKTESDDRENAEQHTLAARKKKSKRAKKSLSKKRAQCQQGKDEWSEEIEELLQLEKGRKNAQLILWDMLRNGSQKLVKGVIRHYKAAHQVRAQKVESGLYYKQVSYYGLPLHLLYDGTKWYLFEEKMPLDYFYWELRRAQKRATKKNCPSAGVLPLGLGSSAHYFSTKKPGSHLVFSKLIGALPESIVIFDDGVNGITIESFSDPYQAKGGK